MRHAQPDEEAHTREDNSKDDASGRPAQLRRLILTPKHTHPHKRSEVPSGQRYVGFAGSDRPIFTDQLLGAAG